MKLSNLRHYAYLTQRFRNAPALIQAYRRDLPMGEAVEWGGRSLRHPPARGGLVGTLLEVWGEGCYDDMGELEPGDVVVDAGAHVGLFSIRAALREPQVRVLAFEPTVENHACLVDNVASYGLESRIITQRCAVGGERGWVRLEAPTARSIDHRIVSADVDDAGAVPVVTLDDLVAAAGGEVAFLKMDIEGAEHDAFARARQASLRALRRVALEYHDNLVPGTLAMLRERLGPTHDLRVVPTGDRGYGLLYAQRKA
jgi:FkbM family methyltransferase